MFKAILYIFTFYSLATATEKQNIVDVLDSYNEAFGQADYSDIVNYFDYSKTIYLGKKNDIENLLDNLYFNNKPFKACIISYLKPIILAKCGQLRNKSEFISLKINSKTLFNPENNPINQIEPDTFSSYLRQFD